MEFGFTEELQKTIVTGVVNGYLDYLTQGKVFREQLIVSSGFSWMKGNYIDSSVAKYIPESGKVRYEIRQKGPWKYIVFTIDTGTEKYKFIMKPSGVFESLKEENYYLAEATKINEKFVKSSEFKKYFSTGEQEVIDESLAIPKQMALSLSEEEFDRFYIVSYQTDAEKQIASVDIYLPYEKEAFRVAKLTKYIKELNLSIPEELLETAEKFESIPEEKSKSSVDKFEQLKIVTSKQLEKDE